MVHKCSSSYRSVRGRLERGTSSSDDVPPPLILAERGAKARGHEVNDGFVVMKDSRARATETASIHDYMRDLHKQLMERGVQVGAAINGRTAWKDEKGVTLKELQDAAAM